MSDRGHGRTGEHPPAPEPLTTPALDGHCHLDLMDVPVEQAVAEAAAVGITRLVTVGIDVPTSQWSADVADAHDTVWAAVAVHPNEAPAATEADWAAIEQLALRDRVVAIGETGIDHFRTTENGWRAQEESFRRHLDIAKRAGKPVMIHDRDAHAEVAGILDSEGAPDAGVVFHCFSGDEQFARLCADRGWVMSFAGNVTFSSAADLRAAAVVAPRELLLVETDAPFLTPTPYRGRPNAPYLVPLTLRAIAELRGESPDDLAAAVTTTAGRLYGLPAA